MPNPLYARRDSEALGNLYIRHVEAMTAENLWEKSAIAAELAWRDAEIERLRNALRAIGLMAAVSPGLCSVLLPPTEIEVANG